VSEENKAFIRDFVQRIQCSGPESAAAAIDELMSPDFVNHTPMGMPPGAEGAKLFMAMLWAGLPDCQATIHQQIAEGEYVVTRKTLTGTHTGDFMGVPPTGKRVNMEVIDILQVRNGKIVSHSGMVDQMGLMQQLGVIPS
jgi:steroid delta-isomerase-like uncharacterized protein